ncbi:MAG TPA: DNA-3-methyladenine glycosylase I [Anaeromyxobacter sp.]|nr:DNA-3-methyladenine glycosylase I [Anaeromyxobacter sp.]
MSAPPVRCPWAGTDPLYLAYHDEEWGVPLRDDRRLFELLLLEGFQAGLSWITILRKRPAFRAAFEGFDPARLARYGARDVRRLLADAGIVRNRAKIEGAIGSARAVLALADEGRGLGELLWGLVDGAPVVNRRRRMADVPAETEQSRAMSKALRARGFAFVGPTICYAFMQASGMVNDHLVGCFRHAPLAAAEAGRRRGARR